VVGEVNWGVVEEAAGSREGVKVKLVRKWDK